MTVSLRTQVQHVGDQCAIAMQKSCEQHLTVSIWDESRVTTSRGGASGMALGWSPEEVWSCACSGHWTQPRAWAGEGMHREGHGMGPGALHEWSGQVQGLVRGLWSLGTLKQGL